MSFQQLAIATRIVPTGADHFLLVGEWEAKREILLQQMADIPGLAEQHTRRNTQPYHGNARITLEDVRPRLRLAAACESAANTMYALAEIAARFGACASEGTLPSRFNRLRKKVEQDPAWMPELTTSLGDLQWYRKIREFRTEWTHHSTVFIGGKVGFRPETC